MRVHILLIFLAITGFMASVACQDLGQFYCGRQLAATLAALCNSNLMKRSQTRHSAAAVDMSWPWLAPHKAHSMGRSKRQVVSECCEKPCTVNELMSYC
ncbi:unnamed protein product, partial [Brenthis ino]